MFRVKHGYHWYNPIINTDWQWLIRLAWGPRRVSSKASYGTKAYPRDVGATLGLWLKWLKSSKGQTLKIVISGDPEGGHGLRYKNELRDKAEREEINKRKADVESRLEDLQRERIKARLEKDFDRADAIRDEIVKAGFTVSDKPVDEIVKVKDE